MGSSRIARAGGVVMALALCGGIVAAFDIDRKVVETRVVEYPAVPVDRLDFTTLRAGLAYGDVEIGEPILSTTKSVCVPEGSDNVIRDAVEVTTHYYEIPYRMADAVVVVRDGAGAVAWAGSIRGVESIERYGHDQCAYWRPGPLAQDWARDLPKVHARIENEARAWYERRGGEEVDAAMFFQVRDEKVAIYTFQDKRRDYADLDQAAEVARAGYAGMRSGSKGGRDELERAVELWQSALDTADLANDDARVNRKVAVKLHESLGAALMVLGRPREALPHLEKATQLSSSVISRSSGTGSADLLERARARTVRESGNGGLSEADLDIDALMRETEPFRGRIPLAVQPPARLARLQEEYNAFRGRAFLDAAQDQKDRRDAAIESGAENPYAGQVQHTAMQGFTLFVMPFPQKLSSFPAEVTALTHVQRLRVPNHGFDSVPDSIGDMRALEVLDLSGNALQSLPASIGRLTNLKKLDLGGNRLESLPDEIRGLSNLKNLQLNDNPLPPAEIQRIQKLLPGCKIKG